MMELLGVFSAFGLSVSAGLNAYIPLLTIALMARFTDLIKLASPWDALTSWWIIGLLVVLSVIEFFADKFPVVNHVNDAIQTFVRPTAGAIAFAASANVITEVSPVLSLAAGLLLAGSVHAAKSLAVRPAVTAATAGIGSTPVSILEDGAATLISVLAVVIPVVIGVVLLLAALLIFRWILLRQRRSPSV